MRLRSVPRRASPPKNGDEATRAASIASAMPNAFRGALPNLEDAGRSGRGKDGGSPGQGGVEPFSCASPDTSVSLRGVAPGLELPDAFTPPPRNAPLFDPREGTAQTREPEVPFTVAHRRGAGAP